MEALGIDARSYMKAMAEALAMMHWGARIDANDVGFVLPLQGQSQPRPSFSLTTWAHTASGSLISIVVSCFLWTKQVLRKPVRRSARMIHSTKGRKVKRLRINSNGINSGRHF
ncbi:uncharacterized protein CC84DRAFT_432791 [Paraphaeosphaeria sporulosa]|uniref:DUF3669 domain-containing protein n=1 Tax=Paraphaeosphaeria sporulosa TaxID=1460663 RepID=A0A177CR50_9PLEO|nr:uncharacterized protein CC84DRAFT_432791 [Paraphaeosphaeria sporulosa]OAG09249.1 hypothetical protein CC84DRAFT_432791 [Paraphaeosphaeria sporulosa]